MSKIGIENTDEGLILSKCFLTSKPFPRGRHAAKFRINKSKDDDGQYMAFGVGAQPNMTLLPFIRETNQMITNETTWAYS